MTYRCLVRCHWDIVHLVDVVVQILLGVGEDKLTQVLPGLLGWQCWGWPIYTFWRANGKINRQMERKVSGQYDALCATRLKGHALIFKQALFVCFLFIFIYHVPGLNLPFTPFSTYKHIRVQM